MKAAVFTKPGQRISIETMPDPSPRPGQVVLKVVRCGICASDLHMTSGEGAFTAPPDSVLGHEFSGEVAAIGAGVDDLKPGDRVAAMPLGGCGKCLACLEGQAHWCSEFVWRAGGYAEYALADACGCLKLPDSVSFADGALVEPMAVALHGVRQASIQPGTKVVVLGAGPIGLATVYWIKHFGCDKIAVIAASRRREALAATMGATSFFINDEKAVDSAVEQLGSLPDVVVECAGVPGMIARAIELVKPRGTVLVPGWCTEPDTFLPMIAVHKELHMKFSSLYSTDDFRYVIEAMAAPQGGAHRAMITDTVSLQALPEVFEALRGRSQHCKVMVSPWN